MIWSYLWINIFLFAIYMTVLAVFSVVFVRFRAVYMENVEEEMRSSSKRIKCVVWILCICFFLDALFISVIRPLGFFYYEYQRDF